MLLFDASLSRRRANLSVRRKSQRQLGLRVGWLVHYGCLRAAAVHRHHKARRSTQTVSVIVTSCRTWAFTAYKQQMWNFEFINGRLRCRFLKLTDV